MTAPCDDCTSCVDCSRPWCRAWIVSPGEADGLCVDCSEGQGAVA